MDMNWLMRFLPWLRPRPAPIPVPPILPIPRPTPNDEVATEVIAAMNAERTRRGLGLLREDPKLNAMALDWSRQMAQTGRVSHGVGRNDFESRLEAVYPNTAGGENVAEGYRTVAEVVAGWMSSPGHRANILKPGYTHAGAGRAYDAQGNAYWTGDFVTLAEPPR